MNDDNRDDVRRQRKTYQKPAMVVVALRPDEAVLGSCKSLSASGPGNPARCRTGIACNSIGS